MLKPLLYYPAKPYIVNQGFGEDIAFYQRNFGVNGHNGLDLQAKHGEPLYASHDGFAEYEIDAGGGHGVVITAPGYKTIYWHMVDSSKEPQYKSPIESGPRNVKVGDCIGYADSTGVSTGDHCHFGLKFIDALGNTLNYTNGFKGAIDPTPYLVGKYPDEITQTTHYYFPTNLLVGSRGDSVKYLQQFLVDKGYLTKDLITGFYGQLTRNAVYQVQIDYQMPLGSDWMYLGYYFGNKTRNFLNNLYK